MHHKASFFGLTCSVCENYCTRTNRLTDASKAVSASATPNEQQGALITGYLDLFSCVYNVQLVRVTQMGKMVQLVPFKLAQVVEPKPLSWIYTSRGLTGALVHTPSQPFDRVSSGMHLEEQFHFASNEAGKEEEEERDSVSSFLPHQRFRSSTPPLGGVDISRALGATPLRPILLAPTSTILFTPTRTPIYLRVHRSTRAGQRLASSAVCFPQINLDAMRERERGRERKHARSRGRASTFLPPSSLKASRSVESGISIDS